MPFYLVIMKNKELSANTEIKLDLKDKKILFELDFHARLSYSELARKVGLSKQGVEYKVNNLIKKGIIKGFYPVLNVPELGYLYCRLPVSLHNATKEKQEEIIKYLREHPKVFWLLEMQGQYDLLMVIWAKSVTEFKEFIEEVEGKYGDYIKKKASVIATDVIHFQHRYLLEKKETQEIHLQETAQRVALDTIDKDILSALSINARLSLVEISQKIKQSAKVVSYHIQRMEKIKFIIGYRPIIDHNKLGFTYYKLFISLNRISAEEMRKLKTYLKLSYLVIYLVEAVGNPADIDIEVMVHSNQQLFSFINDLKFKFPALIGEYTAIMYLDTLKVKYLPF